jgi:hypothetical protein
MVLGRVKFRPAWSGLISALLCRPSLAFIVNEDYVDMLFHDQALLD